MDLPLAVDLILLDPVDRSVVWAVIATVDLFGREPRIAQVVVEDRGGLDHVRLQRFFRWVTPLDIVRRSVPLLLARGIDPFSYSFPQSGYPRAAEVEVHPGWRLTDGFLEEIARRYLDLGRGYARVIAVERGVSPRTATSWIEKARRRGILTRVARGSYGGRIVPAAQRAVTPRVPSRRGPPSGTTANDGVRL